LKRNINLNNKKAFPKMMALGNEIGNGYILGSKIDNAGSQTSYISSTKTEGKKSVK
jgi:hypothetical protein